MRSAFVLLLLASYASAVPALPILYNITQPDGTIFEARLVGDERAAWIETAGGYTVLRRDDGFWVYAKRSGDEILPTSSVVGSTSYQTLGLEKHLHEKSLREYSYGPAAITNGTKKVIVLLLNFTDNPRVNASAYTAGYYDNLLFNDSNSLSMNAYYDEVSYGLLNLTGTVGGSRWYTSSHSMSYYGSDTGSNCGGVTNDDANVCSYDMICEAASLANNDVDFSQYDTDNDTYIDHIIIVHAGCGQEMGGLCTMTDAIWSVSWSIPPPSVLCGSYFDGKLISSGTIQAENSPVGVFAHEFGHDLGLPDLYDSGGGDGQTWEGIGEWGLMASGSWNGPGVQYGTVPAHMSAWSKYYLGWVNPTRVSTTLYDEPISQVETNDDVYQIMIPLTATPVNPSDGGTRQYFLIENRQQTGFDAYIPGSGLLIYHVDDSKSGNALEYDKHVDVEEADESTQANSGLDGISPTTGDRGTADDPWKSSSSGFTDGSTPNSKSKAGTATYINVTDVSASGAIMYVDFLGSGSRNPMTLVGNVTPAFGNTSTVFNFTVNYTHINNTAPVNISVVIDGVYYAMNQSNASDLNYSLGKWYYYSNNLSFGYHTHYFYAHDGAFNHSSNSSSTPEVGYTGPFANVSFQPLEDNEVKSSFGGTVYSSIGNVDIGYDSVNDGVQRYYAKFNLSAIANETVVNAVLTLANVSTQFENFSVNYTIYYANASWSTATLTWNTQPTVNSTELDTSQNNGTLTFNITSLVQSWANGSLPNYGVSVRKFDELQRGYGTFATLDASDNSTRPLLMVTYLNTTPEGIPPNVTLLTPSNGSILNTSSVSFSYNVSEDYGIVNCSLHGNFSGSWALNQTSANISNSSVNYFNLTVADGFYLWNINCSDPHNNTAFANGNHTLTVDTRQPSTPTIVSPINSTTVLNETPSFNWTASVDLTSGVANYTLEVSNGSSFTALYYNVTTNGTLYMPNYSEAIADGLYYVRVRIVDVAQNTGNWSETVYFWLKTVSINEFLPKPNSTSIEFIELYNSRQLSYSLSGWILGNSYLAVNYTLSSNISGRDFLILNSTLTGISLNESADSIFLWNPSGLLADNISFYDGQAFGNISYNSSAYMSIGRSSDGGLNITAYNETSTTPGASNFGTQTVSTAVLAGWNLISIPLAN
ncbi:MAG: M6 family metalloprotease domain-containing protein [Candidatus Altiarchaeota archaeon]